MVKGFSFTLLSARTESLFVRRIFKLPWKTRGNRVSDGSDTKAAGEEALLRQVTV